MTLLPDGRYHLAATFVANSISVFGTTFVTMPLCIRWFGWWLLPEKIAGFDYAGWPRNSGRPLCDRGRRALVSTTLVRNNKHK
jgi:hypothetical protein